MEELLKLVYQDYVNYNDVSTCKTMQMTNKAWKPLDELYEKICEVAEGTFDDLYERIYDITSNVQEASFIAGFSQCAKMLSNGKLDFFPDDKEGNENE